MTRTINSLFTAVLQHKQADDDGGCRVVVEYIAIAMASMCGYAGAKVSPARWEEEGVRGIDPAEADWGGQRGGR